MKASLILIALAVLPPSAQSTQKEFETTKKWAVKHQKPLIAAASILGAITTAGGSYTLYKKNQTKNAQGVKIVEWPPMPEVRKLSDVQPKKFHHFQEGIAHAANYLPQADIVYIALGAGGKKSQLFPYYLKQAADAGKQVLIFSVDPHVTTDIDPNKNIKHIHIKSYFDPNHIKHFRPRDNNQAVILFDGSIAVPAYGERSSPVTQAFLQQFDGNNVSAVVQTLGLVKNTNELKVKTDEANAVAKRGRQLNLSEHTQFSLNHPDGETNLNRVMKQYLDID